ncbi:hypothetical protein [Paenisporosarcina sp. OV554]|uniref:hypothetical protein n=1 Tax=Paenisporosarcina sp. OV554 TaxID=2135694 RepID=UPI000D372242|nr:hypothetical protein [Paenisporosarcina sp. OV554]PUB09978.1 hypothetical protein C8K15_1222 [Paenisporosarcina sp. OV554]
MGLFFEKMVKKKSRKPFIIIKILFSISSLFMLVMGIINDFDFYFLFWLFILVGLNSIIAGIESYFQKEDKWVYLLDLGIGVIFFTLAFQFS